MVRTTAAGTWAFTSTWAATGWMACFGTGAVRMPVQVTFAKGPVVRQLAIARASSTVVRAGRSIVISVALRPNTWVPVTLQRLVGRSWRSVATTDSETGASRFRVVPPKGTSRYRAIAQRTEDLLPGVSRTLLITAH